MTLWPVPWSPLAATALSTVEGREFRKAVSDHFQKGGSLTSVLLVAAGLFGLVLLVWLLTHRQERAGRKLLRNDPHYLFARLLTGLRLPRAQRDVIESVARAAGPPQPAGLLLSEDLFDRAVTKWRKARAEDAGPNRMALLEAARRTLFPQ